MQQRLITLGKKLATAIPKYEIVLQSASCQILVNRIINVDGSSLQNSHVMTPETFAGK